MQRGLAYQKGRGASKNQLSLAAEGGRLNPKPQLLAQLGIVIAATWNTQKPCLTPSSPKGFRGWGTTHQRVSLRDPTEFDLAHLRAFTLPRCRAVLKSSHLMGVP